MKKLVVNKYTSELAKREVVIAFKEVYLEIQRYLLHCLEWAGEDIEKKKYIKSKIEETGQIYKETLQTFENRLIT